MDLILNPLGGEGGDFEFHPNEGGELFSGTGIPKTHQQHGT